MPGQKLTPTLLVGLGGTGKDVLLRVRKQFFDRMGRNRFGGLGYPIVGYLALDTDDQMADAIAGEVVSPFVGRNIRLRREGESPELILCDIKPHEFADYFNGGAQAHPHVFEWMPADMNKYGSTAVVKGAGQNRLFGRLAFFHHFAAIRDALRSKLLEIHKYAVTPDLVKAWLPEGMTAADVQAGQLEVVLVYSLAGGTGAGMFLDAGMLVRSVLDELQLGTAVVIHYLVLPEVITGPRGVLHGQAEMRRKVEENAFAALREMEYFALRRDGLFDLSVPPRPTVGGGPGQAPLFEVQWQRGRVTKVSDAPWDLCYLVGGTNEPLAGQLQTHADTYQMIADQIGLYFDPGEFGDEMRRNRSNDVAKTIDVMPQRVYAEDGRTELFCRYVSRRFSMMGLAQLQFDRSRMRRAAAHRLAHCLIELWWNRSEGLKPNEVRRKAEEDLGTDDPAVVPTVVPDGTADPLAIALVPLGRALLRTAAGSAGHIGEEVTERHKQIRRTIEDGDLAGGERQLREWLADHRAAAAPPRKGERLPADHLRNIVRQNREELQKQIDARLTEVVRYRVAEWGLPDTVSLLTAYQEVLEERLEWAASYRTAGGGGEDWESRVADAKRVPGYLKRIAVRAELLRAADAGKRAIAAAYKAAIADDLLLLLRDAAGRVRREQPGSLHAGVRAFADRTGRVADYLTARFAELSGAEQGRADAKANPEAGGLRQGRAVSLLHRQTEAEYDRRIAQAVGAADGDPARVDWVRVGDALLAELGKSGNPRFADVLTLADLIARLQPPGGPAAADADYDDLARELTEAAEPLLGKFADKVTALDEFFKQPDTDTPLHSLRTFSAPMLRKNKDVMTTQEVDTDARQILGVAGRTSPAAARFLDALKRANEQEAIGLTGLQSFEIKSDAIVLYREKVGIPVCYFAGLDDLGEKYDTSRRGRELHIHAEFFKGRLPEIRNIDQQKQTRMAHALESVLYGVIVGRVLFDPGREVFTFQYRDFARPLGSRLEEVVRTLTEERDFAAALTAEVDRWMTLAGDTDGGRPLALLWAALRMFQEELRARVEAVLQSGRSTQRPDHPLLVFVRERMVPRVRGRLQRTAAGSQLVQPFEELDRRANDPRTRPDERAEMWREWCRKAEADLGRCDPINDTDLPIPVMVRPAV